MKMYQKLDDIVFENRNKIYGAYRLRSEYHGTLNRSLLITLGAFGLFTGGVPLLRKAPVPLPPADAGRITITEIDVTPLVKTTPALAIKSLLPPAPPKPGSHTTHHT